MKKRKILSTKKLKPSLVQRANENGIVIIEQEFISINPIWSEEKFTEVSRYFQKEFVVFTSANAVTTVDQLLYSQATFFVPPWKVFCLAGKTKEAVAKALVMPKTVVDTANSAAGLARKIIDCRVPEVVFFCGNRRREELPFLLNEKGVRVHEVVVYETTEIPARVTEEVEAVLFFSPSAVQSFFSSNQLKKDTICFAVGETTRSSIEPFTDNKIITSIAPGQEDMLEKVVAYFSKNKRISDIPSLN